MTFLRSAALAALLGALPASSFAEVTPQSTRADTRTRIVNYDLDQVTILGTQVNYSTIVQLGDDERIETIGAGDSVSWSIVATKRGNIVFVKPLYENAKPTNFSVITATRVYKFLVRIESNPMYSVRFRYPEEIAERAVIGRAQASIANPNLQRASKAAANGSLYWNYGYKKSDNLKPNLVFDDGLKTFMKFDGDIPGIFLVQSDGTETFVNSRREGEYVVLDKVATQWTLRKGDEATCLYRLSDGHPPAEDLSGPRKLGR